MTEAEDSVHRVVQRVTELETLIRRRTKEAPRVCDELLALPKEEREALVEDGRATLVRSRPVVEELIRRMNHEVFQDPSRAETLGLIAEDVLCCTPSTLDAVGGERGWQDLSARLWAYRANVSRTRCAWEQAHSRLRRAFWHLEKGSGNILLKAKILGLLASLLNDRRHHREALSCLEDAERIYKELGDSTNYGTVLLKKATVHRDQQRYEDALAIQLEASRQFKGFEKPELGAAARINLALDFCNLRRPRRALEVLKQTEPIFELCGRQSTIQLNRAWVSGLAACGLHRHTQAEAFFLEAREGYRRLNNPYDEALVSLELASVYAEQGRQDELTSIAEEIYERLCGQRLYREAAKALDLLSSTRRR